MKNCIKIKQGTCSSLHYNYTLHYEVEIFYCEVMQLLQILFSVFKCFGKPSWNLKWKSSKSFGRVLNKIARLNLHIWVGREYLVQNGLYRHPFQRQFATSLAHVNLLLINQPCQSEIWNFARFIRANEDISGSKISMHKSFLSQIFLKKIIDVVNQVIYIMEIQHNIFIANFGFI